MSNYRIREEHGVFQAEVIPYFRPDVEERYQVAWIIGLPVATLAEAKAIICEYNKEMERIAAIPLPPPPKFHPYP